MNTVTPLQVAALTIYAFLCGLDYIWVTATGIWRPVIAGTVTGLILGDPLTGLIIGSLLEFTFAGLFTIGGGTVPEAATGAIAATTLAIALGLRPEAAVPIAIPVAALTMNIEILVRSGDAFFVHLADRYAEEGRFDALALANIIGAVPWALSRAIPIAVFAGLVGLSAETLRAMVASVPSWFWTAMSVAGGLMPALGMAILMRMMLKRETIPFFILGFALAAYLNLSLLAIALIGAALLAGIYFYSRR